MTKRLCWATSTTVTRERGAENLRCDLEEGHPGPCHLVPTRGRTSGTLAALGTGEALERLLALEREKRGGRR
jgi:hypothetical protein